MRRKAVAGSRSAITLDRPVYERVARAPDLLRSRLANAGATNETLHAFHHDLRKSGAEFGTLSSEPGIPRSLFDAITLLHSQLGPAVPTTRPQG